MVFEDISNTTLEINRQSYVIRKAIFEVLSSFHFSTEKNAKEVKQMICSALSEDLVSDSYL